MKGALKMQFIFSTTLQIYWKAQGIAKGVLKKN